MAIPICDDCAKELDHYDLIDKSYKMPFFCDCTVCKDYFKDKYAIPELAKGKESGLDAIKRFLQEEYSERKKQCSDM